MNAFSSSRLDARNVTIAAAATSSSSNNAKTTIVAQSKRKKVVEKDALFADEDDDEDEVAPASSSSSRRHTATVAPPRPSSSVSHRAGAAASAASSKSSSSTARSSSSSSKSSSRNDDGDDSDHDDDDNDDAPTSSSSSSRPLKKRRTAPEELSSKKVVSAGLTVTSLPSYNVDKKRRDPRFDQMCGDFDPLHFHKHYDWMSEEKTNEVAEWKSELRSGRRAGSKDVLTQDERESIVADIARANQHVQASARTNGESSILQQWKSSERKQQKETGKTPFYLKKSEQKKLTLAARYIEMQQKKGALNKFMLKKTKEVKNRDHKYMPREGREEYTE